MSARHVHDTSGGRGDSLCVLPALRAWPGRDGRVVLTGKFLDGVRAYAQRWPGPVEVFMRQAEAADTNLDHVEVDPEGLPFGLHWIDGSEGALEDALRGRAAALVSLVDRHTPAARIARDLGVPLVYIAEQSLRTRRQIIQARVSSPLKRWYRCCWTTGLERRYRQALEVADGVQCNGTPTFDAYRALSRRPLLYFDTRVDEAMLVTWPVLQARLERLEARKPLRLLFSGRLIDIKGVDHLPLVAAELDRRGVAFTMDVCGDGDLAPSLRAAIDRHGLADRVHLRGVLDFRGELLPLVAERADLFVCCHRQGDPSCTYLETMACGTPIAGYDNEALAGVIRTSGVGWTSPLDRPHRLAALIERLDGRRRELAAAAAAAREFAAAHTFERTMQARVDHLLDCAGRRRLEDAA